MLDRWQREYHGAWRANDTANSARTRAPGSAVTTIRHASARRTRGVEQRGRAQRRDRRGRSQTHQHVRKEAVSRCSGPLLRAAAAPGNRRASAVDPSAGAGNRQRLGARTSRPVLARASAMALFMGVRSAAYRAVLAGAITGQTRGRPPSCWVPLDAPAPAPGASRGRGQGHLGSCRAAGRSPGLDCPTGRRHVPRRGDPR